MVLFYGGVTLFIAFAMLMADVKTWQFWVLLLILVEQTFALAQVISEGA